LYLLSDQLSENVKGDLFKRSTKDPWINVNKMQGTQILDKNQAARKIERMAYQIWENNSREKEIVIAGIDSRGYKLAGILSKKVEEISNVKVILVKITVNKKEPIHSTVVIDKEEKELKNKVVIVVDDVLNSGRTLLYALTPFLNFEVKTLSVATLLNRSYRNFPVQAKYVGTSLSTTLQEHIEVEFGKNDTITAYLR
jgi:pyrimidine operon attenuation protein/uracil phosphoribosyltransferase